MKILKHLIRNYFWLYIRIAQGLVILLLVLVVYLVINQKYPTQFDSVGLQSRIDTADKISTWLHRNTHNPDSTQSFYRLGMTISESIAFTIGNDLEAAKIRLKSISKQTPSAEHIIFYFNKLPRSLGAMDKKALIHLFRNLQQEGESIAKNKSAEDLVHYQLGSWLRDMSLIYAMKDKAIVFQLNAMFSRQSRYFQDKLNSSSANELFSNLLNELEKKPVSAQNMDKTLMIIQQLQTQFEN